MLRGILDSRSQIRAAGRGPRRLQDRDAIRWDEALLDLDLPEQGMREQHELTGSCPDPRVDLRAATIRLDYSVFDPQKHNPPEAELVEGQDFGQRKRHVGRACVVLACRGAGHHADPLSTGRREDLPRSALEKGARWHDQANSQFNVSVFDHIQLSRTGNNAERTSQ